MMEEDKKMKKKQLKKLFAFGPERGRKGHIQCSRSKCWRGSSGDILGHEFDQLIDKCCCQMKGMLW